MAKIPKKIPEYSVITCKNLIELNKRVIPQYASAGYVLTGPVSACQDSYGAVIYTATFIKQGG